MITVACVLRSGGDFLPAHVAMLRDQAARWMPQARFVCFSDVPVPCERIALEHRWPGWWAKLEVFRLTGTVLYFDLDTVLVGDPSPLISDRLTMIAHWRHTGHFASGVMAWRGDYSHIYRAFEPRKRYEYARVFSRWGDQAFIEEHADCEIAAFDPRLIVSFKKHCKAGVPEGARVVCFHGRPRPWLANVKWVQEALHARAA